MHTLDIGLLTDDDEPKDGPGEVHARQYALQGARGPEVNGDQEWVRDGRGTEQTGRAAVVRDITITYGPWRLASRPDLRVHVFYLRSNPHAGTGWTWCWEVHGHIEDAAWGLPKGRPIWRQVYDEAMSCLTGGNLDPRSDADDAHRRGPVLDRLIEGRRRDVEDIGSRTDIHRGPPGPESGDHICAGSD